MPQNVQNHPTLSPQYLVIMSNVGLLEKETHGIRWFKLIFQPVSFFAWSQPKAWETLVNKACNIVAVKVIFFNGSKVCWVHHSGFMSEVSHAMLIKIFLYLLQKSDWMDILYPGKLTLVQDGSLPFDKQLPVFLIWTIFFWNSSQVWMFSCGMTTAVMFIHKFMPDLHPALWWWLRNFCWVRSRKVQHCHIDSLSQPDVACSCCAAFLLMIHQELDQSPECHWMSVTLWSWQMSEGGKVDSTGCLYYELLEFLIWSGTSDDSGRLLNQGPGNLTNHRFRRNTIYWN